MKRSIQTLTIAALSLALTHCGQTPLTEGQRATVKGVTTSTNKVRSSASDLRGTRTSPRSTDSALFEQKLANADCEFTTPQMDPSATTVPSSFNFSVGGPNCPLSFEMGFAPKENGVDMKLVFEVTDPELAELNDVTRTDLQGSLSGDESGASGKLTGTIHSREHGKVDVKMVADMNADRTYLKATYGFADFDAVVEMEQTASGVTYKLNGEEVSESEFQELSVFPLGASGSMQGPQVSGGNTFTYELSSNGCSTGKQVFNDKTQMCQGLQSITLNRDCAEDMRRRYFEGKGCPGNFTPTP